MILKNPTKEDLSIVYRGVEYSIPAGGELGRAVPDDVKAYWKNNIHAFLVLVSDKGDEIEAIPEPQGRVEEVVDVPADEPIDEPEAEEVIEEEPKKATKKAATKKSAK